MKNSLIIILFFILGIISGLYSFIPHWFLKSGISEYVLYGLMFLVGISIGSDRKTWKTLRQMNFKIVLVPLTVIIGSFIGVASVSLILKNINIKDALAVGSGFGYYSLSSFIITKFKGESLGVIALIANMTREITTLIISPLLAKFFGKLAPIACGGATSMDTTLPIITQSTSKSYAIISVFSGVILTILVPFLVTFIVQ